MIIRGELMDGRLGRPPKACVRSLAKITINAAPVDPAQEGSPTVPDITSRLPTSCLLPRRDLLLRGLFHPILCIHRPSRCAASRHRSLGPLPRVIAFPSICDQQTHPSFHCSTTIILRNSTFAVFPTCARRYVAVVPRHRLSKAKHQSTIRDS